MTTPEPPLSAPSASSQALPADQAHPAVLPPVETLRAARQWATEHRHQQPDDRMLAIVYAAGVAAGEARGRTAAAADIRAFVEMKERSVAACPPETPEAFRRNDAVLGAYRRAADIAEGE